MQPHEVAETVEWMTGMFGLSPVQREFIAERIAPFEFDLVKKCLNWHAENFNKIDMPALLSDIRNRHRGRVNPIDRESKAPRTEEGQKRHKEFARTALDILDKIKAERETPKPPLSQGPK